MVNDLIVWSDGLMGRFCLLEGRIRIDPFYWSETDSRVYQFWIKYENDLDQPTEE